MGNVQDTQAGDPNSHNGNATPSRPAPVVSPGSSVYPSLSDGDHDYEILRPGNTPSRPAPPAPHPPVIAHQNSTHTLTSNFHGLDGVPFIVNPKFLSSSNDKVTYYRLLSLSYNNLIFLQTQFPVIKARTMQQLMKDYDYNFAVERQTS